MRSSDAFPSKYLKSADVKTKPFVATISHVDMELVGQGQDQVDLSAFYLNQTPQQAAQALQSIIDATTPGAHDLTLAANDTITFAGIEVHQLSASNDFILSHGA